MLKTEELPPAARHGRGMAVATASYGLYSLQDATVKWLVADYSVVQVLFMRSLVVLLLATAVGGRPALVRVVRSPNKGALAGRAVLILMAWLLFFTAARQMGLAELTTIYFAAPAITVLLSVIVLKETVGLGRWTAVGLGLAGVVVASRPSGHVTLWPVLLALGAAVTWATSGVLARLISRSEGTTMQMITSNGLFVAVCALALPAVWQWPDRFSGALMVGAGVVGGIAQVLMYEGYRLAPASLVAPTEYSAFVWAFLLGYAIWGDVPGVGTWLGAALILAGGVLLIWTERRRASATAAEAQPDAIA